MKPLAMASGACLAALAAGAGWALQEPAELDLVLRGGSVIDGTGNPAFKADVGVRGGVIVYVGPNAPKGRKELDVGGLVVTPGFIDVHTHAENVATLRKAENFVRMGVTTVVVGNCGNSEADLGVWFASLEKSPVSLNVASLVGHNTVRRQAMGGNFQRPPTEAEMAAMRSAVEKAMLDGAVGLSTGLIYLPGTFSKTEEIVELAKVAGAHGGLYASHMRSESNEIEQAIDELVAVAQGSGCRAQLSHIKLGGEAMWGKSPAILAKLEDARRKGVEITQDQYAYTASSTSLSVLIPDAFMDGGLDEFRKRAIDPAQRAAMAAAMKRRLAERKGTDYGYVVIASCNHDRALNGKSIRDIAQARTGSIELDAQIETVLSILIRGNAACVFHGMSEEDVRTFMRHPNTMIASDASCRAFGEDVPHPRGYGNNARVLGQYVRSLGVLRLEDAIRKMTSLPAQTFRLRNRGLIREGMAADVTVFEPEKVAETSTYEAPHAYAIGFRAVIVNGVLTVDADRHTGAMAGSPLRSASTVRGRN